MKRRISNLPGELKVLGVHNTEEQKGGREAADEYDGGNVLV